MQIRVIHEDPAILLIQQEIAQLDTKQLYFIERFLVQEKQQRKQEIFDQWLITLNRLIAEYNYPE